MNKYKILFVFFILFLDIVVHSSEGYTKGIVEGYTKGIVRDIQREYFSKVDGVYFISDMYQILEVYLQQYRFYISFIILLNFVFLLGRY